MIEFSGRMSRVFLKKIQLFFIFFEKTAKTPLPATMSTLYQHSAPHAHPPRAGIFSARHEFFPGGGKIFPARPEISPRRRFFSPPETIFLPPRRIFYAARAFSIRFGTSRGGSAGRKRPSARHICAYICLCSAIYAVGTQHRRPSAADSSTKDMLEALQRAFWAGARDMFRIK